MLGKGSIGNALMPTHQCGWWYPGAKVPGHQYSHCWLNIHYVSYRNARVIENNIRKKNDKKLLKCWRVMDCEETSHMTGLLVDVCNELRIGVMCCYGIYPTLSIIHILYTHSIVVEYTSNHEVAINSGSGMTTNIFVYEEIHFLLYCPHLVRPHAVSIKSVRPVRSINCGVIKQSHW